MASSPVRKEYDAPQPYESVRRANAAPTVVPRQEHRRPAVAAVPADRVRSVGFDRPPSPQSPHRVTHPRAASKRHIDAGLTASGAGAIAVLVAGLGAIIDAAISPGLGLLFDVIFLASCVVVAGRVSWRDAWAATMLPPLVFVASAGIAAQVAPVSSGNWLDRTSADMLAAVVHGWLPLFLGVILAAAVTVRRRTMR